MANLLTDKTNKALVSMSLPISIGMLSTFLFQVIDTYFVGQLGAEALAALSFASTVYFLLVGLFIGFSVGVSIIIGTATGAGDMSKVKKTTLIALGLSLLLSGTLAALATVFIDPVFNLLGATSEVMPYIKAYTVPLLMGIPLLTTGLVSGGILRASGNVTKPEVLMGIAGVINLVLDYALIFGKWGFPEMGIRGAALATVSSWVFIIIGMLFLLFQDRLLAFKTKATDSVKSVVQEIFRLGLPTIATQIIGPFTLMFLTFLLARQSSLAVAAFGVAGRIEILLMIGILGVSTAMTPFIAQNLGAKNKDRIEEAIAFGGRASTYFGLLVAVLLFIFIKPIAGIFSDNAEVVANTSYYFYIVSLSYISYGLFLITTSIFNGLQLPVNSLRISLVKSFLFTVPLTFIGSFWGTYGIFGGLALSNVLAGFYAARQMKKEFIRVNSSLKDVNVIDEYKKDFRRLIALVKKK
ncbi:MAG: MATE family efflux transporter [Bacteroidetes bacterium]|nr:MAG: MATE family efflux transporter [Bacteroidota bacterium]